MSNESSGTSFYFFDCDDNIMFLPTPIFVRNTQTHEEKALSTGEFANVHPQLGKPGEWEDYAIFEGSYRRFRDIPADQLEAGQKQHFVADVERTAVPDNTDWQGPAWDVFAYACEKQRPLSIVTARGHSPATIQAGIKVLHDRGLISKEPNYHTIFPVGNDDVRRDELDDAELEVTTPVLKKRAILSTVEKAVAEHGVDADLRFGMSDDDPSNVSLIIRAMAQAKEKYGDKRFFVINTHVGQMVKLEVFPVNFSVTGATRLLA